MKNIEEFITIHYTKMSKTDKMIFEKIMAQPAEFVGLSISDVAKKFNISSPTVLRAIKKIGYSGYPEFKLALEDFVNHKENSPIAPQKSIFHEIINTYERSFDRMKDLDLEEEILETVRWMIAAKDLKAIGIGNSGLPAQQLIYSLYSQGAFYEAILTETQIYYLKQALKKDCIYFIYTVSGLDYYQEFVELANKAGAKTVVITMNKDAAINSDASKTFVLPAASTFLREDGSLRQLDMRLELFLFSEILSYYYNLETDKLK